MQAFPYSPLIVQFDVSVRADSYVVFSLRHTQFSQ
jgi:hypothetical protein